MKYKYDIVRKRVMAFMLLILLITVHITVVGHRHSNIEHQQDHPGKTAQIHSAYVHCEICAYHFANDADDFIPSFSINEFNQFANSYDWFVDKKLPSSYSILSNKGPPVYYC